MGVTNSLSKSNTKTPPALTGIKAFNNLIGSDLMKTKIYQMVGKTDAQTFITSITSAVNTNPALAECDAQSIISAALLGQSLHLAPSPQLGLFYMVPYNNKKKGCKEAQFQIGYKGFYQMAARSGEYLDIDAIEIREGEYKGRNRLTGKPEFEFVDDDAVRENLPVIGYMAYFEKTNGFIKRIYWSKEKVLNHANEYSQSFNKDKYKDLQEGKIPQEELWKYSSFWYKNFDEMAKKTVMKQLLSKYASLSTELQRAMEVDQAVFNDKLEPTYVDNPDVIDQEAVVKEENQPEEKTSPIMFDEDPMA